MNNGGLSEEHAKLVSRLVEKFEARIDLSEKRICGDLQRLEQTMESTAKSFQVTSGIVTESIPSPVAR